MIEWVLVPVDLSPLTLLAIGLVVYGVARRWAERRHRSLAARAVLVERPEPSGAVDSAASPRPMDTSVASSVVDERPGAPARPWWRGSVGVVPIAVGLAMIIGHGAVERVFGAVVATAASLFLPTH